MELTNEKIRVTHQMMVHNGMARHEQYGVPLDPKQPNLGLQWKTIFELKDDDFDKIETYFILKQNHDKDQKK